MKKRMIAFFNVIFLVVHANVLECMENNDHKVNLKLVDDYNKIYSIARWKVAQELSEVNTLNIPGVTEQSIARFDKELDTIDLSVIQNNKNALKQEIKKKIILHHLPAYKNTFDYLLVAMIEDNIRGNRVKAEEAYSFEPKSVKKFGTKILYIPPIEKLGEDTFNGKVSLSDKNAGSKDEMFHVMTNIPLSTMGCIGLSTSCDQCEVHIYNTKKDYSEPKYIGKVKYNAKNINGLGFTTDLRYLIATFDNMLVSKAALYSNEDYDTYKEITHNIKLADIYLLFHLYKAKEQGCCAELQNNERDYIRDYLTTNQKGKELIQKHFLS